MPTTTPYRHSVSLEPDKCKGCTNCLKRCPVEAITQEGKSHEPCSEYLAEMKHRFAPRYGCGKCQVKVPCMAGIPKKIDN